MSGPKPAGHAPSLLALKPGDQVWYLPRRMDVPHAGERCTVVRGPRRDVTTATVRLEFKDGQQRTVRLPLVSLVAPRTDPAPFVQEARRLPIWKRLLELVALEGEAARQRAEDRARQIVGMVVPRPQRKLLAQDLTATLLEAARAELAAAAAKQAGRGGKGPPPATHLPVPTDELATLTLNQERRAMINNIAKCIHRRYFLSDAELRDLTDGEREQARIDGVLSAFIRSAQADSGLVPVKDSGKGKGNVLYGQLHDSLAEAYPLALEACQMLIAGKSDHALTLALQVRERLAEHVAANTELERARRKHHTGRYFHGDVLSVREAHDDGSMTQFYARLTIVYAEDGHSLVVANAAELESLTATRAGPQAWQSLCRWMEDLSERAGGRKQGRRQDDDEHLIYREDDDRLKLRESVAAYPNILRAFECIRRALMMPERAKDVLRSEIPEHHPLPGYHAPPQNLPKTGGLDKSGQKSPNSD
ncbi:hypothetical protein [Deinococcus multiflagellatus]|uniref:hypothetical protein n=1 Tax=Deinococcus multiflagellatus TaxID=1656887 RepID=UPI001CCAC3C8|nr:hypothetical protein [Deinococcus multiflagellatus]MBZ9713772.1 hypothetical protein [Deinococcus multiflagellatus]